MPKMPNCRKANECARERAERVLLHERETMPGHKRVHTRAEDAAAAAAAPTRRPSPPPTSSAAAM